MSSKMGRIPPPRVFVSVAAKGLRGGRVKVEGLRKQRRKSSTAPRETRDKSRHLDRVPEMLGAGGGNVVQRDRAETGKRIGEDGIR